MFEGKRRSSCWHDRTRDPEPLFWKQRSSRGYALTVVCLAVFTDVFLYGIIVPVIPFSLSERVGIRGDTQHWISVLLAIYGAALLIASPICGWVADKAPSRRVALLSGLVALAGSMAMLCAGSSITVLILGRIFQGFSTAFVWVVGMALLVDTVGHEAIGRDMGYVSTASSAAVVAGPLLGGVVYARAGYYAVFAMAFALLGVDILLRLFLIERKSAQICASAALPTITGVPTSMDLAEKSKFARGAQNPNCLETKEKRGVEVRESQIPHTVHTSRSPPAIIQLLHSRRLLAALWAVFVEATLYTSFDTVLPLYVHQIFNWHSTGAGLLFLPLIIPTFAAPLIGWLTDRYGAKYSTAAGFLLTLPCFVLLRLVTYHSIQQIVLLCSLLVLIGVALTLSFTPLMAEITYVVEAEEKANPGVYGEKGACAQAYGLFNMAWAAGTMVGPIWSGYVKSRAGWGIMAWSLGVLGAVTAVPTLMWMGGSLNKQGMRTKGGGDLGLRGEDNGL